MQRQSSTNPVRISMLDREDKSLTRTDPRRAQTVKSKITVTAAESSHIPRPRMRSLSSDRRNSRKSTLKATGKTPLRQHGSMTPRTPAGSSKKSSTLGIFDRNRSPSVERGSSVGAKGPRKDTRPLSDKTFQLEMLNKIDTFFHCKESAKMLLNSNGSLKPITLKMFLEVSSFLVKQLNIKQVLTITNYVEEIPKIAKKLHYPGIINKSWLKTANAMHSWPNVLGWLSWLVEVCQVKEIAATTFELKNVPFIGTEEEAEFNRHSFLSMLEIYNAWNDEKLDEEATLIDKYLQGIEMQYGTTDEEIEQMHLDLRCEMEELRAVEDTNEKVSNEVKELQKLLASLEQDELKQEEDMKAKTEYLQDLKIEIAQINEECASLEEQNRRLNEQRDELAAAIKVQPMSKAEKETIVKECVELQNYINQFADHLADIQKEIYTLDLKLASANNNLNKVVLAFNKEIFMHLHNDIGVDLEEIKMPEGGALNSDIMEILNAKASLINELKESLQKQLAAEESAFEANTNEIESLQEKLKMLEEDNRDVIKKLQETKDCINKIKTDMNKESAKLKEQIQILENEIKEIEDSMPNSQTLKNEIEEATDKLAAVRRRREFIEQSAEQFFDKLYEILGTHRNELFHILKR